MENKLKPGKLERKDKRVWRFMIVFIIFTLLEYLTNEGTVANNLFSICSTIALLIMLYNLISAIFMIIEYHIKIDRQETLDYYIEQEEKNKPTDTTVDDLKP